MGGLGDKASGWFLVASSDKRATTVRSGVAASLPSLQDAKGWDVPPSRGRNQPGRLRHKTRTDVVFEW